MAQLSHPAKAPGVEKFDENYDEREFAVYKMVPLPKTSTEALLKAMVDGAGIPDAAQLAPESDFANQSLEAIIEKHLQLAEQTDTFNPRTFIVATHQDWQDKGVSLVNLNCDGQSSIDTVSVPAKLAASLLGSLEIGNTDWSEVKESVGADVAISSAMPEQQRIARKIAVYTSDNANMRILSEMLESLANGIGERGWEFQIPVWSNFTGSSRPYEEILAAHKQLWERYGYEKSVFVVADHDDFAEQGWILVKLEDGQIANKERCKDREGIRSLRESVVKQKI